MYSKNFCDIYNSYGWDYFSITMGDAILKYLKNNNANITNHLDLACGVGTLCDFFYKHNIKTMGLDISEDMIRICKDNNPDINFYVGDMTNYRTNEKYDLITITCDAVNHVLIENDIKRMFSNIFSMLNDKGYLIFDIIDSNNISLNTEIISNRDNNTKVYYYITEDNSLINTNVKVMHDTDFIFEDNIIEKLYDFKYLFDVLKSVGFEIEQADKKIVDENQRFEDKIYFICRKQ